MVELHWRWSRPCCRDERTGQPARSTRLGGATVLPATVALLTSVAVALIACSNSEAVPTASEKPVAQAPASTTASPAPEPPPTATPAPSAATPRSAPEPTAAPSTQPATPTPAASPATPPPAASPATPTPAASPATPTPAADPTAAAEISPEPAPSNPDFKRPVASPPGRESTLVRGLESTLDDGASPDGARQGSAIGPPGSTEGPAYTWQDGDRSRQVWLQTDLAVRERGVTDDDDQALDWGLDESIARKQPRDDETATMPVFSSASGHLMTLPGGVLLALDLEWDQTRINAFFATNGIEPGSVETRAFTTNAFFITTEPGFPSLNLANTLAGQDGVVLSSPNWQTGATAR